MRRTMALLALVGLALGSSGPGRADHDSLPNPPPRTTARKLEAVPRLSRGGVTVSGLSSGAFFAHQFHVAYSATVVGAGLVAGGPYGCVETILNPYWALWGVRLDPISAATLACTHYFGSRYFGLRPGPPRPADSIEVVRQAWTRRVIDDPANLRAHRVWLFRGQKDAIVPAATGEALKGVYEGLGVPRGMIEADWNDRDPAANHGMPVARFTGQSAFPVRDCGQHEPPFVVQCGYEAAELLLKHLHPGAVRSPSDDPHRDGTLLPFDQAEFFDGERAGLHKVGYVYVPAKCAEEECRLHVAFHGCQQDVDTIGDDFLRDAGYNRWAAASNIVVLYPQVTVSRDNPRRCWDFWGYTGLGYADRTGSQMRAVKAMVDRLLGGVP